jgi:hypothetical protein
MKELASAIERADQAMYSARRERRNTGELAPSQPASP